MPGRETIDAVHLNTFYKMKIIRLVHTEIFHWAVNSRQQNLFNQIHYSAASRLPDKNAKK